MKFSVATGALALLASAAVSSADMQAYGGLTSFHSAEPVTYDSLKAISYRNSPRKLEVDELFNFWLVSHISETDAWCITAAEGTQEFGNLLLQPCDFNFPNPNQLWYLPFNQEDAKIYSALDDSKCITVNHGENLFDGARARLSDCENGLNTFWYDEDGQIHVEQDDSYCLTNRGPNPHPSDWIHAKLCLDRPDFSFTPFPNIPWRLQLTSGGGCAQPRQGSRRVFLDECDEELAWRISPVDFFGEAALLHSGLNDSKCLRAGLGSNMNDGTRMAVVDCDVDDELQHFYYNGESIYAANDTSLCMVYRGVSANVGVDPIIMKECDESQDPWDVLDLFDLPLR
jgi:hypothetical protein